MLGSPTPTERRRSLYEQPSLETYVQRWMADQTREVSNAVDICINCKSVLANNDGPGQAGDMLPGRGLLDGPVEFDGLSSRHEEDTFVPRRGEESNKEHSDEAGEYCSSILSFLFLTKLCRVYRDVGNESTNESA